MKTIAKELTISLSTIKCSFQLPWFSYFPVTLAIVFHIQKQIFGENLSFLQDSLFLPVFEHSKVLVSPSLVLVLS